MEVEWVAVEGDSVICKLNERMFPGMVMQGDSLKSLLGKLQRFMREFETVCGDSEHEDTELYEIKWEIERLELMLKSYESVLLRKGFMLPYVVK